jgi:hypothetical protein
MITFASCHQYRLDNAMTDIVRDWQLVKYELNDGDSTSYFTSFVSGYTITFTADGFYTESFTYFGTPVSVGGAFNFQNNLNELVLSDADTTRVFEVIELVPQRLTIELINTPDDEDIYYLEAY